MPTLRKRSWRVTVGNLRFVGLDISFDVEKTIQRTPNKLSLRIYNLPVDARRELDQLSTTKRTRAAKILVELEAGYEEARPLIFRGDLRTSASVREGADWLTTLESEDGGASVRWSRVNRSFPPGTRVDAVIRACADAMGVGVGNLDSVVSTAQLDGSGSTYSAGTVLSGPAPDELEGVLRSVGMTYSIQDDVLQILRRGRALQTTAVLLSSGTGLVDVPARQADGTMRFRSLLIPDLYPGRQVQLQTSEVRGLFRITKAKYTGDTAGDPWYVECEGVDLAPLT